MKTNLFKKTVTATLTALVATSLFATNAKADCVQEYDQMWDKLENQTGNAGPLVVGGSVPVGVGGAFLVVGGLNPQALTTAGAGAASMIGGVGTTINNGMKKDDINDMLSLMRDVNVGHGLALNAFYREINTRGFYPEDKVLAFLKEIFAGQALCRDEQVATRAQLLEWAAGAIR